MLRIETLRCWGAFEKRCILEPTNQEIIKPKQELTFVTQHNVNHTSLQSLYTLKKSTDWLTYNMFGFPLSCNISIIQTKVLHFGMFHVTSLGSPILPHWPYRDTWWSDGAIFYGPLCGWLWCWVSLQHCTEANPWWPWMQFVGWLVRRMVGGNFGGGTPAIFFVWGGDVELYIKLSSEHLTIYFF